MSTNAHVASSARQAFMLTVRNVLVAVRIDVFLRETEVNYKYRIPLRAGGSANQEVLRLDIAIDQQL